MTLGKIFHLIHMTGDLPSLEAWYDDVFAVRRGWLDHNYLESEQRDASLVTVADVVIEPLAPSFSVEHWDKYPLGRFYKKFGNHWHSIAWYCEDNGPVWKNLVDNNIRVLGTAGSSTDRPPAPDATLMTHPKDTIAQLEMEPPREFRSLDPRLAPDYDPLWWRDNHPLGLHGLAYTTVITKDLDKATHIYADVLGGTVLERSTSTLTGTEDIYVRVGEAVVQLSLPTEADTIAGRDLATNGEAHHAAAFRVEDLDAAEKYLASKGIETESRDDDTILSRPETTHGVPFRWTTRRVPGDTFRD
ncbi:VOC family protein [Rhodococcus sp. BP-149]|uniref:VOC family protein n=1 Tax=unclassified Rhodococcus (in: high G+C Gram-positive bacteria) TaxID=192944 RepID=UPI001C9B7EEE|nr:MULTISPECIES: VOC family protein [unclassified Rhodococcus (in: high G+C Gram-positive bacteria)]MBY6687781.1 VOC family protein [Rhodococcus sp. BP-288]MBY6696046.1 VOC family protein [Rhodococcus sp. BP-188]MBY6700643.1 VOC family protein [Rhodococcus sp. BP-285]MBY6705040.1 VOC family protein [Rhodococcus sp. BP-283]MBY6713768.1 VOC family protein [Rhodococcus sp. BP-160]